MEDTEDVVEVERKKRPRLSSLPLAELYAQPKMTPAVIKYIRLQEDLTKPSSSWCEHVCKLKCKNPPNANVLTPTHQVDILFIQNHDALPDLKFGKTGESIEIKQREILQHLISKALVGYNGRLPTWALTNISKCQIRGADIVRGKGPTASTYKACSEYLLEEIKARSPKVIVSFTTEATKLLGLKKSNAKNPGEIYTYQSIPVVISLHPKNLVMLRQNSSGTFWGPDYYTAVVRDISKAVKLISGGLTVPNLEESLGEAAKVILIPRTLEDARVKLQEILKVGKDGSVLSFDIETTGLDAYAADAKILTVQFGWRTGRGGYVSVIFPLWHRDNTWYDPEFIWPGIAEIIQDSSILKVGHNVKFDITYVWKTKGVRLQGLLMDTMLLLHSMESGMQGMYGLKKSVWDWLPETGLGGYEDKLPKLEKKKRKKIQDEEDEIGSSNGTSNEESDKTEEESERAEGGDFIYEFNPDAAFDISD